jgi:1,2-phenylacetyl-CoA epoxidase catalytic subunit
MNKENTELLAKVEIWHRRIRKCREALAQAKTEEQRQMLTNYIDKTLMPEFYDMLGVPEAEQRRIDEEAKAAVNAQIAAEIEALASGGKKQ